VGWMAVALRRYHGGRSSLESALTPSSNRRLPALRRRAAISSFGRRALCRTARRALDPPATGWSAGATTAAWSRVPERRCLRSLGSGRRSRVRRPARGRQPDPAIGSGESGYGWVQENPSWAIGPSRALPRPTCPEIRFWKPDADEPTPLEDDDETMGAHHGRRLGAPAWWCR
jgi:hypothetical protein